MTIRTKMIGIWMKLRMWMSPAFIRTKILSNIRQFFSKLFDVKPRDKRDYYTIFRWMVSKRLAFAVVVIFGVLSALYIAIMLPDNFLKTGNESVRTYKYRSIPLKFYSGEVKILANDGYLAFSGNVEKGSASGSGTLYDPEGNTVYKGQFANNMYNGSGTLYYPTGTPEYVGIFADNLFNGNGKYYWPSGALAYSGEYQAGVRSGAGVLYDQVGSQIFQGNFLNNEIVYHDFLDRPTTEVSTLYSGDTEIYQSDEEYCVSMPEIDALYAVKDGSNTLENEWTVDRVYVLKDSIALESGVCYTARQLQAALGKPLYYGSTWVNLPEAVAWNRLAEEQPDVLMPVQVIAEASFENVFSVTDYDRNSEMYLYTFEQDGLLYSFYFTGAGASEFLMYSIEKA